jgi:chemotaxis response regulator CheB
MHFEEIQKLIRDNQAPPFETSAKHQAPPFHFFIVIIGILIDGTLKINKLITSFERGSLRYLIEIWGTNNFACWQYTLFFY